ncbi:MULTISPECIES: toxin-antitoxin system YwqK family antitoxin [unclassified Polaribacter]|uniref:toxin-antitoxin system YwqK family antitoxin n=1 Tax=unclassified Polaribacter TaxID=196858 RepID=UPI00140B64C1|nr:MULTISPECIES: toxin-antitoxin system YwqK family antitoxin [unclassified Polaribacter]
MQLDKYIFLVFICVFGSCKNQTTKNISIINTKEIVNILIPKEQVKLNPLKGQWFYKDQPFNGYAITYNKNEVLSEKTGFFNGKRQGEMFKYFDDGTIKMEAHYVQNKLHGLKLHYFKNGNIYLESNYVNGKKHGIQKTWFINGQLAKRKNLTDGKENGLQQAWLQNGKIYINYEAKNGRTFGLQRANLCYQLKDEKVEENSK